MACSDLELLDRFRHSGDAVAFTEIVRRYASAVYAAGRRILRDSSAAEDVTQETFFRLMRRPGTVTQSLGGWLHQAATRLATDMKRSEFARRRRELSQTRDAGEVTWASVSQELDDAVGALPDELREMIVRHFLRGESQVHLAADLGVSPATLSRRMKEAVEQLRLEMRRRGVDVAPAVFAGALRNLSIPGALPHLLAIELGKMSLLCATHAGARAGVCADYQLVPLSTGAENRRRYRVWSRHLYRDISRFRIVLGGSGAGFRAKHFQHRRPMSTHASTTYFYEAQSDDGQRLAGTLDAATHDAAMGRLQAHATAGRAAGTRRKKCPARPAAPGRRFSCIQSATRTTHQGRPSR